jgi:protein ImuA
MQLISAHNGKLIRVDSTALEGSSNKSFRTGLPQIDAVLPQNGLARGAIHEVLWEQSDPRPMFFATCLAKSSTHSPSSILHPLSSSVIFSDPRNELHPPALARFGIPLEQVLLLKTKTYEEELWAVAQCLACRGVAATVAVLPKMSRVEARRMRLAAEQGGGVGIFLRPRQTAREHAAATRWLVAPVPGERTLQRWKIQLIHGHGGQLEKTLFLEHCRETHSIRAVERLADRQGEKKVAV